MIHVADLFCGAGGESTGIVQALGETGARYDLAAARGFPSDYWFAGNKTDIVRQIGNAVPVNTAQALALGALGAA